MTSANRPEGGEVRRALTDLAVDGFGELAALPDAKSFTPTQIRDWVFAKGARSFDEMTNLSKPLRAALAASWTVRSGTLEKRHASKDGTVGLLTRLHDGHVIESVSIPEGDRHTLCISSQVGCAVACAFCASGLDGVIRNLSSGEIVEQVLVARELSEQPLTNYVFMGSGEPTHNWKAVEASIATLTHPDGLGIGARRITVSTIGHPAALRKMVETEIPFNVALSVHVGDDAEREALMPGLGTSDLAATLAAARERFDATGRRLTAEVVVLAGVNDTDRHARLLADVVAGHPCAVNLIPWNPVDGLDFTPPAPARIDAMVEILTRAGVTTTVRRPRGQDVGVACGQLRRRELRG